jgi:GLPGLI family protein
MKLGYYLSIILIFSAFIGRSQSTEGSIEYQITTKMLNSDLTISQDVDLFPGSYLNIYFTKNKNRLELNLEKGFLITLIADYSLNKGIRLFSSKETKLALECSAGEAKLDQKSKEGQKVILKEETKEILGYTCKKAIILSDTSETVYWYTDKVKFDFSGVDLVTSKLPGFPMEFTTYSNGMLMTFSAINITEFVKNQDEIFSIIPPEGYIVTDEETLKKGSKNNKDVR